MSLNSFAAKARLKLFEDLKAGLEPSLGTYDAGRLKEARAKGAPQVGATRFDQDALIFEFIYAESGGTPTLVTVTVEAPERIVFLPVPDWVVEQIWQGDIDGSYHFESDAYGLVDQFSGRLNREQNSAWFGPRQPKRRE